ncbi:MAG: hypothetical protein ACOYLE_12130 [Bacteroidales bacterium]
MQIVILLIVAALVALLGNNRKIGYGWSFLLCLFLTPIIGLVIILFSKKNDSVDFVDVNKNNEQN